MPILDLGSLTRSETDPAVIDTLKRKGWVERPAQPAYNPNAESISWDGTQWVVTPLAPEMLKQIAFAQTISAGYSVQPEGFVLAMDDEARVAWNQMLSLVREALDLTLITDQSPQTLKDMSGVMHTVTTLRFRQIMVGLGNAYKTAWDTLNS